ncbi:hypothetical protein D3C71_1444180 [compost metagenome]
MIISAYVTLPVTKDVYFLKSLESFVKHYPVLKEGDKLNVKNVGLLLITRIEEHEVVDAYDSRVVYKEIEIRCKWLNDHLITGRER